MIIESSWVTSQPPSLFTTHPMSRNSLNLGRRQPPAARSSSSPHLIGVYPRLIHWFSSERIERSYPLALRATNLLRSPYGALAIRHYIGAKLARAMKYAWVAFLGYSTSLFGPFGGDALALP